MEQEIILQSVGETLICPDDILSYSNAFQIVLKDLNEICDESLVSTKFDEDKINNIIKELSMIRYKIYSWEKYLWDVSACRSELGKTQLVIDYFKQNLVKAFHSCQKLLRSSETVKKTKAK